MKRVRLIGLVTSVRHVQTKTGKMMAIAMCDSFDFKFTVLVFSKEYEALSPLLEEDKILLVEGIFRGNEETGEMSVTAQTIRASTITSIRQQANDLNLFNAKALVNLSGYVEEIGENATQTEQKQENAMNGDTLMDADSQEMEEMESEEEFLQPSPPAPLPEGEGREEFIIPIPSSACKQDLIDLKDFISEQESGNISLKIDIKGQVVDTKMTVADVEGVKKWTSERWS